MNSACNALFTAPEVFLYPGDAVYRPASTRPGWIPIEDLF